MSEVAQKGLNFPEGLDEAKLDGMLEALLEGIDRDRLFQDEKLNRVRHPLLAERMGKEVPLNVEIHNLITDIVTALTVSDRISNKDQLKVRAQHIEATLLQAASDPQSFYKDLEDFKTALTQLAELNPGEDADYDVHNLVSGQLRKRLEMPNAAQEYVLYPPVTMESLGQSRDEVLKTLEGCRAHFLQALEGKDDDESKALRESVVSEAAAVLAWYEKQAA